jgi:hypothetical protein
VHSPFLKKRKEGVDLILNSLKSRLQPMLALPSSFRNTALSYAEASFSYALATPLHGLEWGWGGGWKGGEGQSEDHESQAGACCDEVAPPCHTLMRASHTP